jgi:bacillithiol biosynthesis deacetylase BshB1
MLDLLVIAVHPDDAELGCAGTILQQVAKGRKVGVVDMTRGELGSRGTIHTRALEAQNASKILGLHYRGNLAMKDGFFQNDEVHQRQIIQCIRSLRPEILITNALSDRHPDHGRAGDLVNDSVFLAGLRRIETQDSETGECQEPYRPRLVLQMIQDHYIQPDIAIDITPYWADKIKSIQAYETQFFVEKTTGSPNNEPETYISRPDFMEYVEGRAREFGKYIGATYAEGFTCRRLLGVDDVFDLK